MRCTIRTFSCFRLVAVLHGNYTHITSLQHSLCSVTCLQIAASKMDPNHFLMWILLRFELFDYFNGSCSSKDQVFIFEIRILDERLAAKRSSWNELNLQDELLQWNRVTEEMLYLLIVIVGTDCSSNLGSWSFQQHKLVTDQCCVSRWALRPWYQQCDERRSDDEGGYPLAVHWAHGS